MAKKESPRSLQSKPAVKSTPTRARGSAKEASASAKGPALVIVESPAKAKTIKKYLGANYIVKASVGHIRDLPKNKLNVDLEHDFAPHYEIIRGKSKVIKEIKEAANKANVIYLAPDPDREGEAIAWHIAHELGKKHQTHIYRICFNEITRRAITEALQDPQALNQQKFESQQARRILDRIVGYQISPLLWDKVRRGLSAGRVQSVAVRLIVEREREINAFVKEEYWTIDCILVAAGQEAKPFIAKVIKEGEQKFRPLNEAAAETAAAILRKAAYHVKSVTKKERKRRSGPPLITSKLQQEAASKLRFTAKRTMLVAQQLYEGVELGVEGAVGLITYMRTDSTRISQDALHNVREYIGQHYGAEYVPETPNYYRIKKGAQDAHEAIRPTSMAYPPEKVKPYLSDEQYKLYKLIWNSFIACQMTPAVYDQTTIDIAAAQFLLRATGSILTFPGFLKAYGVSLENLEEELSSWLSGQASGAAGEEALLRAKEGEASGASEAGEESSSGDASGDIGALSKLLPKLQDGEELKCLEVKKEQHYTQPPPRFTESSLVKELEEQGIGRPSTYATILSTIVTRAYVSKDEGKFKPTELGMLVTDLLIESFPQILDVAFTADMEQKLDDVETGKVDWIKLLHEFYDQGQDPTNNFKQTLLRASEKMRDVKREEILTEHVCENCGEKMVIKWGRNGSFLACRGYPKCRTTKDFIKHLDGTVELVKEIPSTEKCPLCARAMFVKRGRFGQFLACQNYPECKGTKPLSIGVTCPKQSTTGCNGYVTERRSKRGKIFYGCANYPKCDFVSWDRPVSGPCPLCGASYLVRKVTKKDGVTIKCSTKGCAYVRDPELHDEDAHVAAAMD